MITREERMADATADAMRLEIAEASQRLIVTRIASSLTYQDTTDDIKRAEATSLHGEERLVHDAMIGALASYVAIGQDPCANLIAKAEDFRRHAGECGSQLAAAHERAARLLRERLAITPPADPAGASSP